MPRLVDASLPPEFLDSTTLRWWIGRAVLAAGARMLARQQLDPGCGRRPGRESPHHQGLFPGDGFRARSGHAGALLENAWKRIQSGDLIPDRGRRQGA